QFWKSTDGGKTFPKQLRPPHGDNHDLWIASNDPQRMIEANDGGGTVSTNGGETWTDEDYPTAQLYHIATTKDYPYHVCGAQQDNSTMCAPSREAGRYLARGSGGDGAYFYAVGGGESGYIAPDPKDPNVFYAGSQGALLSRYDRTIGQARDIQVYPRFFSGEPASALKERWQWTYPIVFSPLDPNVLYTSSQHLWKTTNQGMSWERISPDLTLADPKTLGFSGGPITHDMNGPEIYGTIFTIAPSYHDANTIWTGSDDGLVQITRDGGRTWTKITPPGLPKYARISMIDASRHDPATAYVAAKLYQVDDRAPYIFRTHDFGRTWTKIVTGIGAADFAHVVREDPKRKGLLYAGTEHGIYVSFDDGDHWQSLSLNLPDVQVSDLVVEENDVVIATHGRSAYVLDDVGPLRQLGAQVAAEPVHLFQPRTATRRVDDVAIDYYLRKPADTVTVEILGPNGALVRRFLATAADTVKRDSTSDDDERPRPAPPGRAAGLNRFTWRPRYPAATSFPKMVLWGADRDGPWAPPGRYQVRLSANGVTQTQGFEIRKDPRLTGVTEADLAAQFELASKIRDRVSAANEGVVDIRALKDQITERLAGASGDRALAAAGRTLADRLSAVEEELYQVRNRSSQDPLNFPIKLNNRLAALERIVESADGRPTQQSYTVFNELSAELDQTLGRLRAVMEKDVPAFDRLLAERHLPALGAKPAAAATSTQQ
ncbi:MAG TPA: hypothetical protein VFQ38_16950, partial [Longimicrobiales bacterium]|nr:hypothetical protein [Longimicrobiales bacterium]